ncbi:MAG TPA: phosphotransferase [Caulobacteraceae bacterium]|nr:phosphotransferase [Caulobacteraceae bacterium]
MDLSGTTFQAVPAHWRAAAGGGLDAAGLAPTAPLVPLKGGVSGALICRVEAAEGRFLLRLEPSRIALQHRARNAHCMQAAADAGVAPAVRYSDPAAGVTVMDFIEARPLAEHPGGREGVVRELGALIARVRTCPPFPTLGDGRDVVAWLLEGLAASGLFAPGLLDPHVEALARLRAVRPWAAASLVPSHNDPNPRNLISDGRRLWLVDWELAAQNEPLFDLAIVSTELAETPALQTVLLASSLGRPPDAAQLAELGLVRLLTRLFYGCIALEAFTHPPRREPAASLDAPTPAEFAAAVAAGRLGAERPEATAYAFGLMSLRAFLDGVAAPTFDAMVAALRRR